MALTMSLMARQQLIENIRKKYKKACWKEKGKILDGFIAATGYQRKYAIKLLNEENNKILKQKGRGRKPKYDYPVQEALVFVWNAANQICTKRLIPFLPDMVEALERHGHLSLPGNIRKKLLTVSAATADRMLKKPKEKHKKGISTTKSGKLIKKQIQIRTFADWNEAEPGFMEADLVAHCGESVEGRFLNTLVLTDITTGWTEFFPLLFKSSSNVVKSLTYTQQLLPFKLLGIDTDNGSEFINYELLKFCKDQSITFTRSRAYRKNDQAHVEEKNGSIIRRIIGYDRYEGINAWHALTDLYAVLRCYVNFFQPSVKLISKKREGSKVTKKYDKAKTPYQRLSNSDKISDDVQLNLQEEYKNLDPIDLLKRLSECQKIFWKHAWKELPLVKNIVEESEHITENIIQEEELKNDESIISQDLNPSNFVNIKYHRTKKPRKQQAHRTWRTRQDPFEDVWDKLKLKLQLNPEQTAKSLMVDLILEDPDKYKIGQLRTLQRRVADFRRNILDEKKKEHLDKVTVENQVDKYLSLVMSVSSSFNLNK